MSSMDVSKKVTVLSKVTVGANASMYDYLLADDEVVCLEYKAFRDIVIFTDRKVVLIDVQGITGNKKEWLVLPYSKSTAFSVESAGSFDLDAECKIWASGIGCIELEFVKHTDIREIASLLVNKIR